MWDSLTVKGFQFSSKDEYLEAKKESEAIDYIRLKMNVNDPHVAMKVYYKLLERQNLHTVIGLTFLKQLRDLIISSEIVEDQNLKYIHTDIIKDIKNQSDFTNYGDEDALSYDSEKLEDVQDLPDDSVNTINNNDVSVSNNSLKANAVKNREEKLKSVIEYYKGRLRILKIIIFALLVVIGAVFIITLNSDKSPFVEAEIEVQDKYAGWAEELQIWEDELKLREKNLNSE